MHWKKKIVEIEIEEVVKRKKYRSLLAHLDSAHDKRKVITAGLNHIVLNSCTKQHLYLVKQA
jgi:hypothetical protein